MCSYHSITSHGAPMRAPPLLVHVSRRCHCHCATPLSLSLSCHCPTLPLCCDVLYSPLLSSYLSPCWDAVSPTVTVPHCILSHARSLFRVPLSTPHSSSLYQLLTHLLSLYSSLILSLLIISSLLSTPHSSSLSPLLPLLQARTALPPNPVPSILVQVLSPRMRYI